MCHAVDRFAHRFIVAVDPELSFYHFTCKCQDFRIFYFNFRFIGDLVFDQAQFQRFREITKLLVDSLAGKLAFVGTLQPVFEEFLGQFD
ncbi:hypothetical protein D3C86_2045470 [compost metagenome]